MTKSVGIGLDLASGGGSTPPPASPFGGYSLWLDMSDADQVFQDAALTTPAVADNDPVRGVADKSGNARKWVMAGGYDPLLWRPSLKGCDNSRHDAVFPRLESSGWNVGSVVGATECTIFLVGQVPDLVGAPGAVTLASEGYTGLSYSPAGPFASAAVWNGASSDTASVLTDSDEQWHIVMLRLDATTIYAGIDNLSNAALGTHATTGMDAVSKLQVLTTSYGAAPFLSRYGSLLVYPTALSEAACMFNASWAAGRWGIA